MENNQHAILKDFTALKDDDKNCFLLLTKCILEFQKKNNFELLNAQHEHIFQNYTIEGFDSDNTHLISDIFKTHELFLEIKKCIVKTKKMAKLPKIFNKCLTIKEEKEHFKQFINMFVIINLSIKQLKNKSPQDMIDYALFRKMRELETDVLGLLNLGQVHTNPTKENMDAFCDKQNNYNNMQERYSIDCINDDDYNKLYETFDLFK